MKKIFHGFYELSEKEEKEIFLAENTLFIFDTNCLFNLYRCEEKTRNEVMEVIESVKERIWFPFQVCFEYQRNRLAVIKDSLSDFVTIETELKKIIQIIGTLCSDKSDVKAKYNGLYDELCKLKNTLNTDVNSFIKDKLKSKIKENDYISKSDDVRKWVEKICENKIGNPLSKDDVDRINKVGEKRYKHKVGPGWDDNEKKQEYYFNGVYYSAKYGDLYIWNEILEKAKDESIESIIFITNDIKSDWWYRIEQHGDIYGSLEVLRTELMTNSNCKFKMYTQPIFLKTAKKYLNDIKIQDSSIKKMEIINKNIKSKIDDNKLFFKENFDDSMMDFMDERKRMELKSSAKKVYEKFIFENKKDFEYKNRLKDIYKNINDANQEYDMILKLYKKFNED